MDVSPKTVLKFLTSPLLIEWQCVEMVEIFELLSILCHSLAPLCQLEEFHLLGIPDAVGEIFKEKFPPEGLPSDRLILLLHDELHENPSMLCLSYEYIYRKSYPVLRKAHFCIKYSLEVLQPLVGSIMTCLFVELY